MPSFMYQGLYCKGRILKIVSVSVYTNCLPPILRGKEKLNFLTVNKFSLGRGYFFSYNLECKYCASNKTRRMPPSLQPLKCLFDSCFYPLLKWKCFWRGKPLHCSLLSNHALTSTAWSWPKTMKSKFLKGYLPWYCF